MGDFQGLAFPQICSKILQWADDGRWPFSRLQRQPCDPGELFCSGEAWVTTPLLGLHRRQLAAGGRSERNRLSKHGERPAVKWTSRMRDIVTALARVAGGLVWLIPVLQCLTYHYGDGTYFRGTVDSTGRPEEGELYTKDQQLRLTLQKDGHLVSTSTV